MPSAPPRRGLAGLAALAWLAAVAAPAARADLPKVPDGFAVRLVASVPAVEYPTQIATGPGGRLFIAEDPMDQVGPYEADHGRILLMRDGQEPVEFAKDLRAVFGMAWYDGALYVMHMPYLSVFRDTDGDGKADSRQDLFKDLGPPPKKGGLNDHIVSGLQFGMDGWLYISVGDKGVPGATRPEDGQVVQLKGGGTLRCRPDGTGLAVFTSGTRNHLEPNLDERDNLFTYDNTDDGDGWWTRVTHHVDGGYYGYPYDYHDHPERFLNRMAEYGGGSPCGAVFYKDDAWPEPFRNIGLWAEWGKGKVHAFRFAPEGASFKVAEPIDFMVPRSGDNFHPIDLALSDDGKTLYVADWNMGGWGKDEKVGRVFAVTYTGDTQGRARGQDSDPIAKQFAQLDHPAFPERLRAQRAIAAKGREALAEVQRAVLDPKTPALARRHLVWALDAIAGGSPDATGPLVKLLTDAEPDVRAQAARALGQRQVPLDAAVSGLMGLVADRDPAVRLQALIALGRSGNAKAIPALLPVLADSDPYLSHSARVALRRIGDWSATAGGLKSSDAAVRRGTLLALEQQYDPAAVAALAAFAIDPSRAADERALAVTYLAGVDRKARPWDGEWWGTRPSRGKAPAKVLDWEGTPKVAAAVRNALVDPAPAVRTAGATAVRSTLDPEALTTLVARFPAETDPAAQAAMAATFAATRHKPALPALVAVLRDPKAGDAVRDSAIDALEAIGAEEGAKALIGLLQNPLLSTDRQPKVIAALGRFQAPEAAGVLAQRLASPVPAIRIAAARALGQIGRLEGVARPLRRLIEDTDPEVRKTAIAAIARLKDRDALADLMAAADRDDTRFEAITALAEMPDPKALRLYLRGLADKSPELRVVSARALSSIRDQAAPVLDQLAQRKELPPTVVAELRKVYSAVQPIAAWRVLGPVEFDATPAVGSDGAVDFDAPRTGLGDKAIAWKSADAIDPRGQINLHRVLGPGDNRAAFAYAELESAADRRAQFVGGSDDTLTVWVNGEQVHNHGGDRGYGPESDKFEANLKAGTNRILVRVGNHTGGWQFALAVSQPSTYAFLEAPAAGSFDPEAYKAFALKQPGDVARGQVLFADLKGLACIKCHKVGKDGGTVGPDLSGIGAKYKADEVIDSVLYPSAKIFSGYEPVVVGTVDGRVLTGIVKSDDEQGLVIQDADDKTLTIPKAEIDDRRLSDVSLMPNGLAEGLKAEDFADLVAYLMTLKETVHDAAPAGAAPKAGGGR